MRVAELESHNGSNFNALAGEQQLQGRWWIGEWLVDFASGRIITGDTYRKLTLKACGVLRELASDAGQPVTREVLLGRVWKDTMPTDDVLSQAVSELRKAMRDDPRNARYIETITKVGYRLKVEAKPAAPAVARAAALDAKAADSWSGLSKWFAFAVVATAAVFAALLAFRGVTATGTALATEIALGLGGHVTPVSSDPGLERYPAISPDGNHIVYSARRLDASTFGLFIKSNGASEPRELTSSPDGSDYMASWSPDGLEVAFLRVSPGDCGINIVPVMGGFARRVGECTKGTVSFLDWSPDGRYLVFPDFSDAYPESVHLQRIDLQTGAVTALPYLHDAAEHDVLPRYSPDGRWIAFRRGAYPYSNLFLMAAEGGPLREIARLNAAVYGMDWLADSSGLVFSSNHLGRDAIVSIDIESGRQAVIDWRRGNGLSLSGNDDLTWSTNSSVGNLWEYAVDDPESNQDLFQSTRNEYAASYAPDGQSIAFISDRSGSEQIWWGDLFSGETRQISDIRQGIPKAPRWSPDGRHLVYSVQVPEGSVIYMGNVDTGEVQVLIDDVQGLGDAVLAEDGNTLVYAVNSADGWHLWRTDVDSQTSPQLLTIGAGRTPHTSPSDNYIYYTRPHGTGIWRVPLAGGEEEQVTDQLRFRSRRGWTMTQQGIFYVDYQNRKTVIQHIDWAFAEPEVAAVIESRVSGADLSIHPNGNRILLTRHDDRRADIVQARGWRNGDPLAH